MKNPSLTIASLLGALFFTIHLAHDFIYGIDSMTRPQTFAYLAIIIIWLYGALELPGRRAGYVIMLLVAIGSTALPILHTVGGPRSAARGFPFVWTLLALGATGVYGAVVSARELVLSFRNRSQPA